MYFQCIFSAAKTETAKEDITIHIFSRELETFTKSSKYPKM